MIFATVGDVLLVKSNKLANMPELIEVQVDELIYGESVDTDGILLGYSAKVIGTAHSWLVLPDDIVYKHVVH